MIFDEIFAIDERIKGVLIGSIQQDECVKIYLNKK
jgi:hypothetical protein